MSRLLDENKPTLVLSFGAFAFEFMRRSLGESSHREFRYWNAEKLGKAFRSRLATESDESVRLVPLLHVSIARGKLVSVHENFTSMDNGNYFDYVGERIADYLCENHTEFPIK